MPDRPSPSVRARQLARELRQCRAADGRTGEEIGALLGWSAAKVSRIETGKTAITAPDLRKLLDIYHVPDASADRLLMLARGAGVRGWWSAFSEAESSYQALIGLEAEATALDCYSGLVLHGFLQTEEYARHIIGRRPVSPPREVDRLTEIRLRRQRRLDGPDPLEFRAVLDEAAVRRQVGGSDVMRAQLRHLVEVSDRPNVTLQVLPFSAGAQPATSGSFIILRFPFTEDDVVYVELMYSSLFVEQEIDVFKYGLALDELREKALDPEASIGFIKKLI